MYELILLIYLISFLYLGIVTSSWRAGCFETVFWFSFNGGFMLLLVLSIVPSPTYAMIVLAVINTTRATMLLIMGRGAKPQLTEEEAGEFLIEEEPVRSQSSFWQTEDLPQEARQYQLKAVKIATRYALQAAYQVEDVSNRPIGYDLKLAKNKAINYVLVKIKIEADGVIIINPKEYDRAREYKNLYYLFVVLGGVDPWEEEIHIVRNPYGRLNFSYDKALNKYVIDCDDIRNISKNTF